MDPYHFGPAVEDERIVYGARRPEYDQVDAWMEFMREKGIWRVCCLLEDELTLYPSGLLQQYEGFFGEENVCPAAVEDYHLMDKDLFLNTVLPFLVESVAKGLPVVVHCAGGNGRTGHVLAAWLSHGRGLEIKDALDTVFRMGRDPYEAIKGGYATQEELVEFLMPVQVMVRDYNDGA